MSELEEGRESVCVRVCVVCVCVCYVTSCSDRSDVVVLTDANFEHDTQASSGATTGMAMTCHVSNHKTRLHILYMVNVTCKIGLHM